MNKWILLVVCLAAGWLNGTVKAQAGPDVFIWNGEVMAANKAAIDNKDPKLTAVYKNLLKEAGKALQFGPVSVMEKKELPPSGNRHDYMSLAPYHWPDSSKPGGLPYIRRDGSTNPEVKAYKDKEYMPALCNRVQTLALAWYFSGDRTYARHAAKLLRVWFLDTATRMNPNLDFAQAIKGVNTGRGAGLIDARHFIKVIDAVGLLKESGCWKEVDQAGLQKWFSRFLNWMQTSRNGLHEMNAANNHGVWYDALRLSIALFTGKKEQAKSIVQNAVQRLDKQMDNDGMFPKEMERTISLHYTVFVMDAFFHIAAMAEKTGFDFRNHTTPSGKSLQKAFRVLKPYIAVEKEWKGQQIKPYPVQEGYYLLLEAARRLNCSSCRDAVTNLAGDKADRLTISLLY